MNWNKIEFEIDTALEMTINGIKRITVKMKLVEIPKIL